jgi:hypothetical protein
MDMNLKNYHENNGSSKKPSKLRVRLQDIMDAMEMQFDEVRDMEEDEYEENFGPEGMEQVRAVSEGHGDYISLPDRFEINEYDVIREFALDNPDKKIAEILLVSIQGSGAFRRFKDMLYIHGIEQEWYGYRNREYEKIAIKWCERHGIEYER